ncbi:Transglutaminase-like superfamily protein [Lachnospiraceae bacterium XBB1006]|nr:Transglutaminase-like superfamily protein [Lachnospiraceae bacterium XBB1006]
MTVMCEFVMAELPTEQKVKEIVEKLSDNLEYDDDDREDVKIENHNLIGPIFYKKSVCEGNAKLVQQLCSMLGIEAQVVTGYRYGGGHVWNEVRVNGEWMEVDVTREIYEKQYK